MKKDSTDQQLKGKRKRICLALDLKNDKELINDYKKWHEADNIWTEIPKGIIDSGILVMDIYNVDNRLFMICELDQEKEIENCFKYTAGLPKQDEWAKLMTNFQKALPGHELKWVEMELVFSLPR